MYADILIPIDLDDKDSWSKALPTAIEYCRAFGARLHVLNVVPSFSMGIVAQYFPKGYEHEMMRAADKRLHEFVKANAPDDVEVQHIVAQGRVHDEIVEMAEKNNCDLIILSSQRRQFADYVLGTNGARVVNETKKSVLVVRD